MARYTGKEIAREHLLDVAKHVVHAAYKAPQITGRLKLQAEIITGEDLVPIIEGLGVLAKVSQFVYWDYTTFKDFYEAGNPPVLVLIGAETTISEMNWNCGACGFATCSEFNRYAKENRGTGVIGGGPCCNWKVFDLGIACDWACAAASQYNVDNRIQGSSGGVAATLGYLPGCSSVLGLPLGPSREMVWYSRDIMHRKFKYEDHINTMLASIPTHFMAFAGSGRPVFKAADRWWEANNQITWGRQEQSEEKLYEVIMEMAELTAKYGPQIEARYKNS
ncbi:hypothetical protein IT084_02360 [Desulfallas sp. Bu1-1]|jgi:uncharacterized ferredoxin-like protein|uniref:DUF2148 domain-containing protein n=1 Tax=Desulfallas sp. Bu1-1 TaxID=2787620 RepID=UPI00189DEFF9|nr:DUF2148 domain-containing protein [Desulfallas sp. Bu1-1]MBF7081818.1 hypothetical protein [Desulfallas sp. Bu1-1]